MLALTLLPILAARGLAQEGPSPILNRLSIQELGMARARFPYPSIHADDFAFFVPRHEEQPFFLFPFGRADVRIYTRKTGTCFLELHQLVGTRSKIVEELVVEPGASVKKLGRVGPNSGSLERFFYNHRLKLGGKIRSRLFRDLWHSKVSWAAYQSGGTEDYLQFLWTINPEGVMSNTESYAEEFSIYQFARTIDSPNSKNDRPYLITKQEREWIESSSPNKGLGMTNSSKGE